MGYEDDQPFCTLFTIVYLFVCVCVSWSERVMGTLGGGYLIAGPVTCGKIDVNGTRYVVVYV